MAAAVAGEEAVAEAADTGARITASAIHSRGPARIRSRLCEAVLQYWSVVKRQRALEEHLNLPLTNPCLSKVA